MASVSKVPVVLRTVPGVDEVTVATITQPFGGIAALSAIFNWVVRTSDTAAQVVAFVMALIVTPGGMASMKGTVRWIGWPVTFGSPIVKVDVAPNSIVDGENVWLTAVSPPVTVNACVVAGALPSSNVVTGVVSMTVPGVDDVRVAAIVQVEAPSITFTLPTTIIVDCTLTPTQVVLAARGAAVTPAGSVIDMPCGSVIWLLVGLLVSTIDSAVELPGAMVAADSDCGMHGGLQACVDLTVSAAVEGARPTSMPTGASVVQELVDAS